MSLNHVVKKQCHKQTISGNGGWATPLKNMTSSIGMRTATQYFWENAKLMATKPPSRFGNYTIYHNLPVVIRGKTNPSINQPTNGNLGHLWNGL